MGVLPEMILAVASCQLSIRCQLRCASKLNFPNHGADRRFFHSSKQRTPPTKQEAHIIPSVEYPIIIALFIFVAHSHTIALFIHLN
jgi:hypothetical protein